MCEEQEMWSSSNYDHSYVGAAEAKLFIVAVS